MRVGYVERMRTGVWFRRLTQLKPPGIFVLRLNVGLAVANIGGAARWARSDRFHAQAHDSKPPPIGQARPLSARHQPFARLRVRGELEAAHRAIDFCRRCSETDELSWGLAGVDRAVGIAAKARPPARTHACNGATAVRWQEGRATHSIRDRQLIAWARYGCGQRGERVGNREERACGAWCGSMQARHSDSVREAGVRVCASKAAR